jgi:biotin carboxyl carrier protein
MIYYITVEGETLKLEVVDDPEGHTFIRLPDGREITVDFDLLLGSDYFSLLADNESHEIYIAPGEVRTNYHVTVDGQIYEMKVETERQHRLSALVPRDNLHAGELPVKAPMPGLVTTIAVEVGQTVTQGQRLIVLEAMKMENELKAPKAGMVKVIYVEAGQTVEQNRPLLVLE